MKIKNSGKITSLILVLAICVTSFTGCGKKKSTTDAYEEAKKIDKNCVYKQEDYEGIIDENDTILSLGNTGNKILSICETPQGLLKYVSFNSDGSDIQAHEIESKEDAYIIKCAFDNEGNAYMDYYEPISDQEVKLFLMKVDPSGKVVCKHDLSEEYSKDSNFIQSLAWTDKYGLLCGTPDGIQTFDEQNGLKIFLSCKDIGSSDVIFQIAELPNNKLFLNLYSNASFSSSNIVIDVESKKAEKKLKDNKNAFFYNVFSDDNNTVYIAYSEGFYKYNEAADKLEKLMDCSSSSVSTSELYSNIGVAALSENEFVAALESTDSNYSLVKLTKVKPEDVADKTVITMAMMYSDSNIENQIMRFNRSSDQYVIKIIDYSAIYQDDYDQYDQIEKQFNLDLTSGNVADIICFPHFGTSVKKYADKGILLDLTSAFENGGPLGDIEFLPNIEKMMRCNDKIYSFMPTFEINTTVVRSSYADGKTYLTYDDCDKLIKSKGIDYKTAFCSYYDKTTLCSHIWTYYGDEFVNPENKKCNFTGPEFIELLNHVNNFPAKEPEVDVIMLDEIDSEYVQDKAIFYDAYFRNIFDYMRLKQAVFKDDIEMIGYPNNIGKNLASIQSTSLAVNSKTEHKDVIYDLIRELLTYDSGSADGFSTVKPKFEEELQEAAKEFSDDDNNAFVSDPISFENIKLTPLSQEEIKKFYDYTVSIETNLNYDTQISNIVAEESSAFFEGQKSAEEVSKIIQNRVSNYINEIS